MSFRPTAVFQPSYVKYTPYGLIYPLERVQGPAQTGSGGLVRAREVSRKVGLE
jgi:hypothetical protein